MPEEQRAELWKFYFDKLDAGLATGYNPKLEFRDEELVSALRQNIAEFCAFKEASFRNSALDLLIDDKGRLRGKSDFMAEAMKINDEYNRRWLATEFDQTVASANMAEKWQDIQRTKDLYPNLRYCTVGDGRVRPEHEVLEGVIKPVDDPFWATWYPPNDWGCRCYVEPTDEDTTGDIPGGVQAKIEFDNNPAESGKVFSKSIYMTSGGLNPEMIEKIINWGIEMFKKVTFEAKVLFEKAKLKAPYKTTFNSGEATVKVSVFADKVDLPNNIDTAKIIAEKLGVSVKIRPHLDGRIIKNVNNAEYEINGLISDRKAVKTSKIKNLRNAYRSAVNQGCECIVFDLDESLLTINAVRDEVIKKFKTFPKIREVFIKKGDKIINMKSNP